MMLSCSHHIFCFATGEHGFASEVDCPRQKPDMTLCPASFIPRQHQGAMAATVSPPNKHIDMLPPTERLNQSLCLLCIVPVKTNKCLFKVHLKSDNSSERMQIIIITLYPNISLTYTICPYHRILLKQASVK